MNIFVELMKQTEKPAPMVSTDLDRQFWAHAEEQKLCFQRCDDCSQWRHIPRYLCANCGSNAWHWEESSGRGTIYSWTVVHLPLHPAFAKDIPYTVGIVELDEGVRMVATITGFEPGAIDLGSPVELYFDGEPLLPRFRPGTAD